MGSAKRNIDRVGVDRNDLGRADTLRFNVITYVSDENYEKAIGELKHFVEEEVQFPKFKEKITRYIEHSIGLVSAIRAKRKFPGIQNLTMAKQQELSEIYLHHLNELQNTLVQIEKMQTEIKLEDIRSTVWVVKAFVNAVFVIAVVAFILEASRGLAATAWIVTDYIFLSMTDWIFNLIGL